MPRETFWWKCRPPRTLNISWRTLSKDLNFDWKPLQHLSFAFTFPSELPNTPQKVCKRNQEQPFLLQCLNDKTTQFLSEINVWLISALLFVQSPLLDVLPLQKMVETLFPAPSISHSPGQESRALTQSYSCICLPSSPIAFSYWQ